MIGGWFLVVGLRLACVVDCEGNGDGAGVSPCRSCIVVGKKQNVSGSFRVLGGYIRYLRVRNGSVCMV